MVLAWARTQTLTASMSPGVSSSVASSLAEKMPASTAWVSSSASSSSLAVCRPAQPVSADAAMPPASIRATPLLVTVGMAERVLL